MDDNAKYIIVLVSDLSMGMKMLTRWGNWKTSSPESMHFIPPCSINWLRRCACMRLSVHTIEVEGGIKWVPCCTHSYIPSHNYLPELALVVGHWTVSKQISILTSCRLGPVTSTTSLTIILNSDSCTQYVCIAYCCTWVLFSTDFSGSSFIKEMHV